MTMYNYELDELDPDLLQGLKYLISSDGKSVAIKYRDALTYAERVIQKNGAILAFEGYYIDPKTGELNGENGYVSYKQAGGFTLEEIREEFGYRDKMRGPQVDAIIFIIS